MGFKMGNQEEFHQDFRPAQEGRESKRDLKTGSGSEVEGDSEHY